MWPTGKSQFEKKQLNQIHKADSILTIITTTKQLRVNDDFLVNSHSQVCFLSQRKISSFPNENQLMVTSKKPVNQKT